MDKAGGYGYQGLASFFIEKINGDYWNVVCLCFIRDVFRKLSLISVATLRSAFLPAGFYTNWRIWC